MSNNGTPSPLAPRSRSTRKDEEELTVFAVKLLSQRLHKHQVKDGLREYANQLRVRAGKPIGAPLSARTCERYIARARDIMACMVNKDRKVFREESILFWESFVSSPSIDIKLRMFAQEQIDRIMGNAAPLKLAATDSMGNDLHPIRQKVITDEKTRLLMAELAERVGGLSFTYETDPTTIEADYSVRDDDDDGPAQNGHAGGNGQMPE